MLLQKFFILLPYLSLRSGVLKYVYHLYYYFMSFVQVRGHPFFLASTRFIESVRMNGGEGV